MIYSTAYRDLTTFKKTLFTGKPIETSDSLTNVFVARTHKEHNNKRSTTVN